MTARPLFLKLAAFFFAFVVSGALVAAVDALRLTPRGPSFATAPPPRRATARTARPAFALADNLDMRVGLVTLDREAGRSYTALSLRHVGASLPPERLWVRTHFFAPGDYHGRVWAAEAVELVRPFDGGADTTALTVAADWPWCDAEDAPPDGYFARVQVSESPEETPLPQGLRFNDPASATPVVVHARSAESSRR